MEVLLPPHCDGQVQSSGFYVLTRSPEEPAFKCHCLFLPRALRTPSPKLLKTFERGCDIVRCLLKTADEDAGVDGEAELGERHSSILCGKSKTPGQSNRDKGVLCPLTNRKRPRRPRRTSRVGSRVRSREDSSLGTFSLCDKGMDAALAEPLCKRNSHGKRRKNVTLHKIKFESSMGNRREAV